MGIASQDDSSTILAKIESEMQFHITLEAKEFYFI